MAASTMDVMYLTFNCEKTLVDVPVFADHLLGAFSDGASSLPEILVL